MNIPLKRILTALLALSCALACETRADPYDAPRERLLMDPGWKFHMGDDWGIGYSLAKAGRGYGPVSVGYGDSSWRTVDLPHDWAIELPFDPKADGSHGFRPVGTGFHQNSVGWYRKTFDLPKSDAGRRLWLEFDGVYRNCRVFVNGWFVGHHESGYNSFRYDITDVAEVGGANTVAVRVDASEFEGWFYEGAGIYRHVWLVKTAPLAIAPDGVFVFARFDNNVPQGDADLHMRVRVHNAGAGPSQATVDWKVLDPDGATVASSRKSLLASVPEDAEVEETVKVHSPRLWSPETPQLYRLVTTVNGGDRVETPFGIKTVAFDADRGFILNGKPYTLKGTSNHQDHAGVGSALPDALQYFRIARLKEMGCNAYRSAHNPPTPELLDACDRLGMLVMDENRQLGSDTQHMDLLEEQVRRDRNHASVAIWSLGNEEFQVQATQGGKRVAAAMQARVKQMDSTRPITFNADVANVYSGVNEVIEVRGWSYRVGPGMDAYHKEHPLQPNVGSEQGSTVGTRGIYADDKVRGYVSAYDDFAPWWAQTAEQWMTFFSTRPWMSGGFVWTGFDYRGEPTPYGWPCISSHFGILDTCGFPKDNFWYYKAWWTEAPVLHILPHWNWRGREGQDIDVRALSNCDEVELFLNGKSMGRQSMTPYSSLRWKVPYAPGALSAKGYRAGSLVAEEKVETTGAPAAVRLAPDRGALDANGEDAAVFTVSIVDAQGRVVPDAGNHVAFSLDGPGRVLGVGNGDPSCHEPDTFVATAPSRSRPIGGWHWKRVKELERGTLPEVAAQFDDAGWEPVDVGADTGALGAGEKAVYRARCDLTPVELAAPVAEIVYQKAAGGLTVYVNGTRVGNTSDTMAATVLDVKEQLHPGPNVIAVAANNWGSDPAGLSRGVELRLQDAPAPVAWSRSAFNGLAEVIVQSSRAPGTLRLTASADGLQPATFELPARAATPPPSVP